MEDGVKGRLVQMLHDCVEVFAWSYEDMSGLDTDIVVYHLPIKEDCPPVKQKVCRMRPDLSEKIKAEVMKQFNAGFLAVTSYPQWVRNRVPVPKKYGKVCMCIDYRDLNRESPRMISHYHISISWLIILLNTKFSPSWMTSPDTTKSKWHPKKWRKPLLLQSGTPSVIKSCLLV